ncbi:ras-related protein Rab-3 [Artemisia annua]|uniref:Ras-related protein Rab-3 n=1 Tax=Artemisia annua TaxID=35608 RepID=A0A2U1MCQ9_ARTAN|nr:ras-related protein Rab-3 [Artemisia annua]
MAPTTRTVDTSGREGGLDDSTRRYIDESMAAFRQAMEQMMTQFLQIQRKTTLVKTCLTGEFLNNEECTRGVEYHLLDFLTTKGKLRINCWDVEEKKKFRVLRDHCYKQCDFAIIMFDVTKKLTYKRPQME